MQFAELFAILSKLQVTVTKTAELTHVNEPVPRRSLFYQFSIAPILYSRERHEFLLHEETLETTILTFGAYC
jgi:hypothetical protein